MTRASSTYVFMTCDIASRRTPCKAEQTSKLSHVCLVTTRRVSHLTLTATRQEICKQTRREKSADSCQHRQESDKKNTLKRRKHRAKTVRCFPLLSAFGSRFGSNGPATRLVDSYWRQITQCRGAQDLRRYKQRIHRHSIIV